jgi:hypothetical protein
MPRYMVERTFPQGLHIPVIEDGPWTAATRNGLPVDQITRVSVLDPYFYR